MPDLLIYGSYGFSGSLITAEAIKAGLEPMLAGRDARRLEEQADTFRLRFRAFALDDATSLDAALAGTGVVLNCAGPFAQTWRHMVNACIRSGAHYLDITGEIEAFESLAALDSDAREASVMLLPGVGFDVVPSDCLAAHLKRRLPAATSLILGIDASGGLSRGTLKTVVGGLGSGGRVRSCGELRRVPLAWKSRRIDFGTGPIAAVLMPLADVSTAYRTTGIPNVEAYVTAPRAHRSMMRLARHAGWLLARRTVRRILNRRVDGRPPGPDPETRARTESRVWGEVRDEAGGVAVGRLHGPNGYTLTATAAIAAATKVLGGAVRPGYQTPAGLFGPDFVLELGVTRHDVS